MNKEKQIWEQPGYDFDPPYPASTPVITHYDLLVSKTPQDMAERMVEYSYCPPGTACKPTCKECWLSWLNASMEEDDK